MAAPAAAAAAGTAAGVLEALLVGGAALLLEDYRKGGGLLPPPPSNLIFDPNKSFDGTKWFWDQFWGGLNNLLGLFKPPMIDGKPVTITGSYSKGGSTFCELGPMTYSKAGRSNTFPYDCEGGFEGETRPRRGAGYIQLASLDFQTTTFEYPFNCGASISRVVFVGAPGQGTLQIGNHDARPYGGSLDWSWGEVILTPYPGEPGITPATDLLPPGEFAPTPNAPTRFPDVAEPLEEERPKPVPYLPPFSPPPAPGAPVAPPISPPAPGETGTGAPAPDRLVPPVPIILLPPGQGPVETGQATGPGTINRPGITPVPVPVGPDGKPIPQPKPDPITTPNDQTNIGIITIPGPGPAPQADLQGIATEVGKIERKLEIMLLKDAFQLPELPPQDLGPLFDAMQEILDILQGSYGSGAYQLVAPCQEGVTATASWAAGAGQFDRLSAKVDALAAIIQAHKNQRQPTCVQGKDGQPVTVQFQEIG